MMTITAKEANKLALDRLSANEAKTFSDKNNQITLEKVYAAINKIAKKGEYEFQYFFSDNEKRNIPNIIESLKTNGFITKEVYNHVEKKIKYNYIEVSWKLITH